MPFRDEKSGFFLQGQGRLRRRSAQGEYGFAARGVGMSTVRSAAVPWPSFPVAAAARLS